MKARFLRLRHQLRRAREEPSLIFARLRYIFEQKSGFDRTQWSRIQMYETLFRQVRELNPEGLSSLEISSGGSTSPWRQLGFAAYKDVDYPDFDICHDVLNEQFDVIIADQVFEHLLWPHRAARHVYAMLKPGGRFIVTTPFLIRYHPCPIDCSRWTETGLKHLLAEAGFQLGDIETGSWGNKACVLANLHPPDWAAFGWGRSLANDTDFPVVVWAIAQRSLGAQTLSEA